MEFKYIYTSSHSIQTNKVRIPAGRTPHICNWKMTSGNFHHAARVENVSFYHYIDRETET